MVQPHICKVKHGKSQLFVHHGMSKAVQLRTVFLLNLCPERAQDLICNSVKRTANACTHEFSELSLSAA